MSNEDIDSCLIEDEDILDSEIEQFFSDEENLKWLESIMPNPPELDDSYELIFVCDYNDTCHILKIIKQLLFFSHREMLG